MTEQQNKIRAAKTILQKGVKVPLITPPLFLRMFGKRTLSVRFWQPSFDGIIEMAGLIAEMGLNKDSFENLTTAQCYELIHRHGDKCMQILAICILRWPPFIWLRRRYARWLSKRMEPAMVAYALQLILTLNDVGSFTSSIRSLTDMEEVLSPKNQGSQQAEQSPASIAPGESCTNSEKISACPGGTSTGESPGSTSK